MAYLNSFSDRYTNISSKLPGSLYDIKERLDDSPYFGPLFSAQLFQKNASRLSPFVMDVNHIQAGR